MITEDDLKEIQWCSEPNGICKYPHIRGHIRGTISNYNILAVEYSDNCSTLYVSSQDSIEVGNIITVNIDRLGAAPLAVRKELVNYINSFLK